MTAAEIVDDVQEKIKYVFQAGGFDVPGPEEILRTANIYNDRTSKTLKIPRRYVKGLATGKEFSLDDEARPGSLLFAESSERHGRIRILTVAEANQFYPDWEDNELEGGHSYGQSLLIYDPGNISASLYPIGFDSGDELRVAYVVKPRPMVLENSEDDPTVVTYPWENELPEYHHVVAHYTTFDLLLRIRDNGARAYYEDAKEEEMKAFAHARNAYHLPQVRDLY